MAKKQGHFYILILSSVRGHHQTHKMDVPDGLAVEQGLIGVVIHHRYRHPAKYGNPAHWSDDKRQASTAWFQGYETDSPEEMLELAHQFRAAYSAHFFNVQVYDLVGKKLVYKEVGHSEILNYKRRMKYNQKLSLYGEKINVENLKAWGVL